MDVVPDNLKRKEYRYDMEEGMAKKQEEKLTLEEALEKLEETIAKLQSEEVSLEESFSLYKEGMDYVKLCSETIDQVEKRY